MNIRAIYAVWRRHYLTGMKMIWPTIASNVANPLLFLFSFGFGLGAVIPMMADDTGSPIPYLNYVIPGMMGYSVMFAASFESSIAAYTRMTLHSTWNAILSTPVSLYELLLGEIFWAAAKAMLAGLAVLAAGYVFGGIPTGLTALWTIPFMIIGSFIFSSCALLSTSVAQGYDQFSYFFTFWVTPMFMFAGVFFPVDRFPEYIQWITYIFPMTYLLEIIRPISTGLPLDGLTILKNLAILAFMGAITYSLAYRNIHKRLFT